MTINGYSSLSYALSSYGTRTQSSSSGTTQPDQSGSAPQGVGSRFKDSLLAIASANLNQTDPALAKKLDSFNSQIQGLEQSGASNDAIGQALKSDFDSLSGSEKSEVKSAIGPPPGSRGQGSDPISQLEQSDPALAKKLEDFKSTVDQLRQSGASDDTIKQTMKQQMDSLSDTDKSEMKQVFGRGRPQGPPPPPPTSDSTSSSSTSNSTSGSSSSTGSSSDSQNAAVNALLKKLLASYSGAQFGAQSGSSLLLAA